jgi:hypothetical protein
VCVSSRGSVEAVLGWVRGLGGLAEQAGSLAAWMIEHRDSSGAQAGNFQHIGMLLGEGGCRYQEWKIMEG